MALRDPMQHELSRSATGGFGDTDAGGESGTEDMAGFSLFFVDQAVLDAGLLTEVLARLERKGLDVLLSRRLDPAEQPALAERVREHRREVPGSRPGALVATHNLEPTPPSPSTRHRRPHLDDETVFRSEKRLNFLLRQQLPERKATTPVRACENAAQAWELFRTLLPPQEVADIRAEIERRREGYQTPFPVIRRLDSGGERAKVELVWYDGKPAVCKVFRPGKERFFEAELVARRDLAAQIEEMADLIAYGPNWLLSPYYESTFSFRRDGFRLLSLDRARQAVRVLEKLYLAGYAHMDFSLKNVVFDKQEGMKLVDSEYLYRYPQRPARFEESYDIAGVPDDLKRDPAVGRPGVYESTYSTTLQPYIGLSLDSLLHDPPWLQHLKRAWYAAVVVLPRALVGRAKSGLRAVRSQFYRWPRRR